MKLAIRFCGLTAIIFLFLPSMLPAIAVADDPRQGLIDGCLKISTAGFSVLFAVSIFCFIAFILTCFGHSNYFNLAWPTRMYLSLTHLIQEVFMLLSFSFFMFLSLLFVLALYLVLCEFLLSAVVSGRI